MITSTFSCSCWVSYLQGWEWSILVFPVRNLGSFLNLCAVQHLQTLSSWATSSVEEVASVGPGIRFFQLYVRRICLHWISLFKSFEDEWAFCHSKAWFINWCHGSTWVVAGDEHNLAAMLNVGDNLFFTRVRLYRRIFGILCFKMCPS